MSMFECNFVVAFIFKQRNCLLFLQSAFGLVFLHKGDFFLLNGRLSLLSVKLCSAQKFMIGDNISIV